MKKTRLVWVRDKSSLYTYDFDDNQWAKVGGGTIPSLGKASGAIDPVRRQFVIVGSDGVWTISLDGSDKTARRIETTGININPKEIAKRSPGFDYDPKRDRFVLWAAADVDKTPGTVYFLDMDKKEWTSEKPAIGPTGSGGRGIFGRWRYVPKLDAFVAVKSSQGNVWVYAPDETSSLKAWSKPETSLPSSRSDSTLDAMSQAGTNVS